MQESSDTEVTVESLKEKGNQAIKDFKYHEAALHYTCAIKMDPENYTLYSNRSLAYLMLKYYYLALTDAEQTILINPSWPKGYFRKGEVQFTSQNYNEAYDSYSEALKLKPDDPTILKAITTTAQHMLREKKMDREVPWVGAGIGIIIGVSLLLIEYMSTSKFTHPLVMAFITIIMSLCGYLIAKFWRMFIKRLRKRSIQRPEDFEETETKPEEEKEEKRRTRYTKSQARMRYRKGKA